MTTPDDYSLDPADVGRARELVSFDPVYGAPSPVQVIGDVRLPAVFKATALPPEARAKVEAELKSVPLERRSAVEHRLVEKHLYQNSYVLRVKAGLGENATPIQREAYAIVRDIADLEQEALGISAQLAEVGHWDKGIDELTGKPKAVAVERIQGDRRKALEARLREIDHQVALLNGVEGNRRHAKALKETLEAEKRTREAQEERAEIVRRSEDLAREQRINSAAATRARFINPGDRSHGEG